MCITARIYQNIKLPTTAMHITTTKKYSIIQTIDLQMPRQFLFIHNKKKIKQGFISQPFLFLLHVCKNLNKYCE